MAIAFVTGAATAGSGSGTTLAATMPASIVSGNLLIAFVNMANSGGTFTTPTGWTVGGTTPNTDDTMGVFWKVAGSSEPATTTFTGSGGFLAVAIEQYSGVNATPLDGTPTGKSVAVAATAVTSVAATASVANDMALVAFGSFNGDTFTTPTGTTARNHAATSGTTSIYVFEKALTATGSTGTFSSTQSASDTYASMTALLAPAATSTNISVSDTGTASDALTVTANIPLADTGTASDVLTVTVPGAITYIADYTPTTNPTASTATPSVSITAGAGDTLVLAIGGSNPATVTTPPSGGGLTWTQRVAKNPTGSFGCLYMYTATSSTAQTFTLTATMSSSTNQYDVVVARYSGVGGVGVTGSNNSATGNPTLTVTTTVANSYLHVSDDDWNATSGAATWVTTSGTPTIIADDVGSNVVGHNAYYQLTAAGSKTVGMSAPTGQTWILGAVELTPVTSTSISLADTGSGSDAFTVVSMASALPDTVAGADALTVPTVRPVLAEAATAADALTVTASAGLSDAAAGTDALPTITATVALPDAGNGADLLAVGGIPHTVSDSAAGVDALAVTVRVPLTDTATGADVGTGRVIVVLTDAATASETFTGGNKAVLADAASVADHLSATPPTTTKIGFAVLASGEVGIATLVSNGAGLATLKVQLKG